MPAVTVERSSRNAALPVLVMAQRMTLRGKTWTVTFLRRKVILKSGFCSMKTV